MTKRMLPRRRQGGRRHKRVRIYDTQGLMELFETNDEEEVRRELQKRVRSRLMNLQAGCS